MLKTTKYVKASPMAGFNYEMDKKKKSKMF